MDNQYINDYVDNLSTEALRMALKQVLEHGDKVRIFMLNAAYEAEKAFKFPVQ